MIHDPRSMTAMPVAQAGRLQKDDARSSLRKVRGSRKAREAASDDDEVGLAAAVEAGIARPPGDRILVEGAARRDGRLVAGLRH